MRIERESLLYEPVSRYVRRRRFTRQSPEAPFFEYRMDLYAFSPRESLTIAVELKLRRWRRALQQALIYQLCADMVYVALPAASVARVDQDVFRHHGVGLIAVRSPRRCVEVVPARKSSVMRSHYRDHFVNSLTTRGINGGR